MANILVVDDEELARFCVRDVLETAGHEVQEAENGVKALAAQKEQSFDLVVTDIIMPEKEGVETILEMRKLYPDIKIVAISGGGRTRNMDFLKLAKQFGADRILAKPFSDDELMEQVDACLSG